MEVKTYRAETMQQALALVRRDLGPTAAVLHTREVHAGGVLRWLGRSRMIEVTATTAVMVPSRLANRSHPGPPSTHPLVAPLARIVAAPGAPRMKPIVSATRPLADTGLELNGRRELRGQLSNLQQMVDDLCRHADQGSREELPESFFRLFTDLIDAEVSEELARELVDRVRREAPAGDRHDAAALLARVSQMIEAEIAVAGPIALTSGRRHLVALVGPTGVGKTTTIAKLAANFRLKEKRRVGLITVDTYRIAAVEQLRTYADIIDLPMEVVSTPREMHQALARLSDLDLVLMDTAGRSPRDDVRIQELKSMLAEAAPDEVHLVLSAAASAGSLANTAQRFAEAGTTTMVLTKLDEATGLGNLLPLARASRLPLSYVTNGQNVPDDIEPADPTRLARIILGTESATRR